MPVGRAPSVVSVFAGVLLAVTTAHAQVPGEEIARRSFQEGVVLEKKGDYAAALVKFKESEQIKATLGNRYHKAFCLEMTGKLAAAVTEYEAVEKAAREANKAELAEAAHVRLDPLRTSVPRLSVTLPATAPKDAEASLDGAPLAAALLDGKAFRIDPGEHVLSASAPGRESFEKRFTAAEGGASAIEIVLAERAAPAPTPIEATEPSRSRTLPIATTAGAVVLIGAGVAAFVVAGKKQDDLRQECASSTSCTEAKGPTRTFDALALGGWVAGAGLAALSVVLWTSAGKAAQANVAVHPSWAGVEGRF